jgi:hypothetical protein
VTASRPGQFTPRERVPGTHRIGGSLGPRAGLDAVVKRKIPRPHLTIYKSIILQLISVPFSSRRNNGRHPSQNQSIKWHKAEANVYRKTNNDALCNLYLRHLELGEVRAQWGAFYEYDNKHLRYEKFQCLHKMSECESVNCSRRTLHREAILSFRWVESSLVKLVIHKATLSFSELVN